MFGIELTSTQKLEAAFICVILGIAGVLMFRNVQPKFDTAIITWKINRTHPLNDPNGVLPVTTTNPRDPKKDETVTVLAVQDGKMEVSKFPNDPSRRLKVKWDPDQRHPDWKYLYYKDPMARVEKISDPFRHALAYATYSQVYRSNLSLLRNANMTSEQLSKEVTARETMNKENKLIDAGVDGGTFHPELLDKIAHALDAYDAAAGDPTKDKTKADLARKLLDAANDYFNVIIAEKDKKIDAYIAVVEGMLSSDQKQKFIDGFGSYVQSTQRAPTPVRGRVGTVTITPRTTAPVRGSVGTAPARGGAGTAPARGVRGGATVEPG
jgi:hypothetical protein